MLQHVPGNGNLNKVPRSAATGSTEASFVKRHPKRERIPSIDQRVTIVDRHRLPSGIERRLHFSQNRGGRDGRIGCFSDGSPDDQIVGSG